MKITLCMAMSLDGYIADRGGGTPWSDEGWDNYCEQVNRSDALVLGRVTFDEMMKDGDLIDFSDTPIYILSNSEIPNNKNHIFIKEYSEFEKACVEKGYKDIMLAGGTQINTLFIEKGYVDELYIDVEPYIFGSGLKLFESISQNHSLNFLGSKQYGENGVQLQYATKK